MDFSKPKIYAVIGLAITSLVGIIVVQSFWINASFENQKKQFDSRINKITTDLTQDIRSDSTFRKKMLDFILKEKGTKRQISGLKKELAGRVDSLFTGIYEDISYEFGLIKRHAHYSSQDKPNRSVLFSSLSDGNTQPLLQSKYHTCPCIFEDRARINFYFPNRNIFVAKQLAGMLGLSILCIFIVVGCFAYTIFTIRRQKKLAEMKNDFINNMTHEFKTPIFSISLASKVLEKSEPIQESEKSEKYLNLISDENERLKKQVNKVLQMTKVEPDGSNLEKEEVDLHKQIRNVAQSFDLKLASGGSINLHLNAEKYVINADKTHLENILSNLIDNAIKYSEKRPNITITTEDREGGVCFQIADEGVGMDSETKKHIFEKFYRAQTGDIHDVKGFGLGLSYVKSMVEAHKGWIRLKSKLNKGSTFTIFLPS